MKKIIFSFLMLSLLMPTATLAAKITPKVNLGFSGHEIFIAYVGGNIGFDIHPIFRVLAEFDYGFPFNIFLVGGGADIYFSSNKKLIARPYAYGTSGFFVHGDGKGGYARFGGGVDFKLYPVIPFVEIGGLLLFDRANLEAGFNMMGGVGFNL